MARLKLHQSLLRPQLMLHADRTYVILGGMAAAMFAFAGYASQGIVAVLLTLAVYALWIRGGQLLAKKDPLMFQTFIRSLKYRRFYPARTPVFYRQTDATGIVVAFVILFLSLFVYAGTDSVSYASFIAFGGAGVYWHQKRTHA